jgi:hypothetical protein
MSKWELVPGSVGLHGWQLEFVLSTKDIGMSWSTGNTVGILLLVNPRHLHRWSNDGSVGDAIPKDYVPLLL